MVTIANAVAHVKDELPQWLQAAVMDYLAKHPELVVRKRQLTPLTLVTYFVTQVIHGNTAIQHLRHLTGMRCSATAYCNARQRLPLALLEYVTQWVTGQLLPEFDQACRWRGRRIWHGDGSSFSMPDTPELQGYFGQPGAQAPGCGFPVASLLVLCNAAGLIVKTVALPLRTHEASHIAGLLDEMAPGDVLAYDRAGCSYAHLALLFQRHLHGIFRMHQRQIVSFRPGRKHAAEYPKGRRTGKPRSQWLKRLGERDQLVRWFKPVRRPEWMTAEAYQALPDALELRELRYTVNRKGFRTRSVTLVTTLVDAEKYPANELADQYLQRWNIEVNFRHLKQTMKMDALKCKTYEGVLKELAVFVLVYNLVRLVMLRAAARQKVAVDRISFVDALRWLQQAKDIAQVLDLIVNPRRPDRIEPRVVKRRPKPYPLMTRPRRQLREALGNTAVAA